MSGTYGQHYRPSGLPSLFLLQSYLGDPGENPRYATWEVYDTLEGAQAAVPVRPEWGVMKWTPPRNPLARPVWEGYYELEHLDPNSPRYLIEEIPFVRAR